MIWKIWKKIVKRYGNYGSRLICKKLYIYISVDWCNQKTASLYTYQSTYAIRKRHIIAVLHISMPWKCKKKKKKKKKCKKGDAVSCPQVPVMQGRIQGGGGAPGGPPPKIGKNMIFFGVKSWFFTRNTPKMFAPPSARRNFFKCAPPPPPLTWNPGSAPVMYINNKKYINVAIINGLCLSAIIFLCLHRVYPNTKTK